jgi:hypothetical protein
MLKIDYASGVIYFSDSGDEIFLLEADYSVLDAVSWGNTYVEEALLPPAETVPEGWSLERWPAYVDTDTRKDWRAQPFPAPYAVDVQPPSPTPTLTPTRTTTPTRTPTPLIPTPTRTMTTTPEPLTHLLISEFLYDQVGGAIEVDWIEIYNPGPFTYVLADFVVGDAKPEGDTVGSNGLFTFPEGVNLAPGEVLVIASDGREFFEMFNFLPDYETKPVLDTVPDMLILTGYGDGIFALVEVGDEVLLLNRLLQRVDAVSWGMSSYAMNPACTLVQPLYSMERWPPDRDTGTCADWRSQEIPNPGSVPAP